MTAENKRKRKQWWIATFIVSIAVISWVIIQNKQQFTEVKTLRRESKTIQLPGGSNVYLNASTILSYKESNWKQKRYLELDGEAYFDVSKGKSFQVKTQNGLITVLGTKFNIRNRNDQFKVSCYSGVVAVSNALDTVLLTAGHRLILNDNQYIQNIFREKAPGWTQGKTTLENVTPKQALAELVLIFDIKLNQQVELTKNTYAVSFPHNNLKEALDAIFTPIKIEYNYDTQSKILSF